VRKSAGCGVDKTVTYDRISPTPYSLLPTPYSKYQQSLTFKLQNFREITTLLV